MNIKKPLFIIADDGVVRLLHEPWEVDCCGMESIDVADGVYTAYDSEGQKLKLVTINEDGKIERPTENIIDIPFLGRLIGVVNDKQIQVVPLGEYDEYKLIKILMRDLSRLGYHVDGLTLKELVALY